MEEKTVNTKLGELMLQGWTMTADSCFGESCQTPLMRDNVTRQLYCVGCEAWVVTKEKTKREHKYTELVSLEGKRNIELKNHNEVSVPQKQKYQIEYNHQSFRDVLEGKLLEMSSWLQSEKDVSKCNVILDGMTKIFGLLKEMKEVGK